MENQMEETTEVVNFLIGPTKTGKTTLCHFLSSSKISVKKKGLNFFSQALENDDIQKNIGNDGHSKTSDACYFMNFCDFPGVHDTRGDDQNLNTLLLYYKEIQKTPKFRMILIIEEGHIITGSSSFFFNFCNELIDVFGLRNENSKGMHVVVSKSCEEFVDELPGHVQILFPNQENFIIEGVKNRTIKVTSFNKPVEVGSEYVFADENRRNLYDRIQSSGVLSNYELRENILPNIFAIIEKSKANSKTLSIINTSEISDTTLITADNILVIDKDIDCFGEYLEINSPIVIVKAIYEKRSITLRGHANPVIRFSDRVKLVINGDSLILSTVSQKEPRFLEPTSKEFRKNDKYLRLESICVNNNWTEYASHNNKFIDLIVYFNPHFGKILVDDQWKIKRNTCDINFKLHINECMRTKKNAAKVYNSLRQFDNVKAYLESCEKNVTPEIIEFIEGYIVNLPTIFEILMKPSYFPKISSKDTEIQDLRNIRKIFLRRYIKLAIDFKTNSKNLKVEYTENNYAGYSSLINFINRLPIFTGIVSHENNSLIDKVDEYITCAMDDEAMSDFFNFFYALCLSKEKNELNKYQITGDTSKYPNFEAFLDVFNKEKVFLDTESFNYLASGSVISLSTIGILLGSGVGQVAVSKSLISSALETYLVGGTSLTVGAALVAIDLGINLICTIAKSGYYKNVIQVEGRNIRLDCRI
ncbi:hypothetical protein SteCoe_22200 [Stentor coeruleus]|uniref:Uncharacterized protein n=1 Tax=Stentor coeruleus TaxID=5963 RepID=A0A1R2BN16_9CILI|nr:hypothetical protein SteCoe_22200 [Stentor coeruleus]